MPALYCAHGSNPCSRRVLFFPPFFILSFIRQERWLEPGTEYFRGGAASSSTSAAVTLEGGPSCPAAPAGRKGEEDPHHPPLRFFPFSMGPRDCIGQTLAKMNYTATLACLLGRFHFELAAAAEGPGGVGEAQRLTLQPAEGMPVRCVPRVGG
jgi:hypothetical protein